MRNFQLKILTVFLLLSGSLSAYNSEEMVFIPWGVQDDQLSIQEPVFREGEEPGSGSLFPYGGPLKGFVDTEENVYLCGYDPGYFKCFNRHAELVMFIQPDSIDSGMKIYQDYVCSFYVDSLFRIYLESAPPMSYITILDRDGHLIDRLNPFGPESGVTIGGLEYHAQDVLTFDCWYHGLYTYVNGDFIEGASSPWRAGDGYYYFVDMHDKTSIMFKKYLNPDLDGYAQWRDTTYVPYDGSLKSAGLLAVDDSLRLYIRFIDDEPGRQGIQVYNDQYELLEEIILPGFEYENKYMWSMKTFVRRDGTIYEFRCQDDGLHVVRWSRE